MIEPLAIELDHVIIKASRAQELYKFFAETLKLPVAHEFKVVVPGVFSSGAIGVGNMHIEVAQVGEGSTLSVPADGRAEFGGLCMDINTQLGKESLDRRGLQYEVLAPPGADGKPMFTNYKMSALTNHDQHFSLTAYRAEFDPILRKRSTRTELQKRAGGPLGVICAREVAIGTSDTEKAKSVMEQLCGSQVEPHRWRLTDDDPTVVVVRRNHPAKVIALTLKVKDIDAAAQELKARGALTVDIDGALLIKAPHAEGLTIKVVG